MPPKPKSRRRDASSPNQGNYRHIIRSLLALLFAWLSTRHGIDVDPSMRTEIAVALSVPIGGLLAWAGKTIRNTTGLPIGVIRKSVALLGKVI